MADLSISNTVNRTTASPGDTLIYTTTIKNDGTDTATGVVLTNDVPLQDAEYSLDNGQTWQRPWSGHLNLNPIASGAGTTVLLRGIVSQSSAGNSITSAPVIDAANDTNKNNNTAAPVATQIAGPAVPGADLYLTSTVDREKASPGDVLTYTTQIKNNGPDTATAVVLTNDTTLTGAEYSTDNGRTWSPWPGHIPLDNIASGAATTVLVRGTIPPAAQPGTTIRNVASVAAANDPNPNNNNATANTEIVDKSTTADLAITNTVNRATAAPGDMLTYTTTIKNNGPATATGIVLTNDVPLVDPQYSLNNGQTWMPWPGHIPIDNIANGDTATVLLRGTVAPNTPNGTTITSAPFVKSAVDTNPNNDKATATTNIFITSGGCQNEREQYNNITNEIKSVAKETADGANTIRLETSYVDAAIDRRSTPSVLLNTNRSVANRMDEVVKKNDQLANRLDAATATLNNPACPPSAEAKTDRQNAINDVVKAIADQENAVADLGEKEAEKINSVVADSAATINDIKNINDSVANVLNKTQTNNTILSRMMDRAIKSQP